MTIAMKTKTKDTAMVSTETFALLASTGAAVVGAAVVGATVVGTAVVGAALVGAVVVGDGDGVGAGGCGTA